MKILYGSQRYYLPQQCGGAQNSIHTILRYAQKKHHHCEAVVMSPGGMRQLASRALHKLTGGRVSGWPDHVNGYPTFRGMCWHIDSLIKQRIQKFNPDILLMDQVKTLEELKKILPELNIPIVFRIASIEFINEEHDLDWGKHIFPISNSHFTAGIVKKHLGIDTPVVYPVVDFEKYRTVRENPQYITFVNPVPLKGVDLALDIAAAMPDRQFLFVEGWGGQSKQIDELKNKMSGLTNITLFPFARDMRTIYAKTKLLIVPSLFEEAFGRVVVEAQVNGIPVVARNVGGLSESVGNGGVLMKPDASAQEWRDVIEDILAHRYEEVSAKAYKNVKRPEFDPGYQAQTFLDHAISHIKQG